MSQGRLPPPIAPEDDWFDEPEWFPEPDASPATGGETPREPRTRVREPVTSSRDRRRGRRVVVLAILGALALGGAGVVAARSLTGSGSGDATTQTTTEATPTTPTITTAPETTTPTTPTTTEATTPEAESLRPGAEGPRVRQLQDDLVALGYSTGGVDGKYGPATERAVRAFQTSSGLVVDGVAGPATLAALAQALEG